MINPSQYIWRTVSIPLLEPVLSIDEKILLRQELRKKGQYEKADQLRQELEQELIFINDAKDGQDVYYLTEAYFKNMGKSKQQYDKVVQELAIEKDANKIVVLKYIKAELEKRKDLKIVTKRAYFDYRIRQELNAEAHLSSWLHRFKK